METTTTNINAEASNKPNAQTHAKAPVMDQAVMERFLNSYQILTLELISIFCNLKRIKQKDDNKSLLLDSTAAVKDPQQYLSITDEIKLLNLIIKLIKTVDLEIETILNSLKDINIKLFDQLFELKRNSLVKDTLFEIRNLIGDLKIYFIVQPNNDALIRPWSIVGRYVRRCIIIYEKLSFDKLVNLCKNISSNLQVIQSNNNTSMALNTNQGFINPSTTNTNDLDSSIILSNLIGEPDKCSSSVKETKTFITSYSKSLFKNKFKSQQQLHELVKTVSSNIKIEVGGGSNSKKESEEKIDKQQIMNNGHGKINNCNVLSRKIAEYFVAQQAFLIENNEYDALSPTSLQQKLDELSTYDPTFLESYYLKYLNKLRLNDYTMSLKYLHDYFDRFIVNGSISLAALNLATFEYRFKNIDNSFNALKDAITSAHQEQDNVKCLQHCLSWLYKINASKQQKLFIKNACSKALSNDLFDLASYNLHYFARNNIGVQKPSLILDLLNKTDLINIKMNSKTELNLLNKCHKAALWKLYGNKKISNLYCQLLLNLLPKSGIYKLNTESQLISMCYVALNYSDYGLFQTSQNILNMCKIYYTSNMKLCEHWLYAENLISIKKAILNGQWCNAKVFIERLASTNERRALIEEMNMSILEGNLDKASDIGEKLLEFNSKPNTNDFTNDEIYINLWYNRIQINIKQKEYSNALISAIKLHYEIKQLDFNYELNTSSILIAKILLEMNYPEQAIKYLEKSFVFLLSSGKLIDQAKLHFLYAKCLVMINNSTNLQLPISHMYQCVEKLENAQAFIYLKEAYSYLSLLLNEMGSFNERNKYSLKYRLICKQLPFIGFLL